MNSESGRSLIIPTELRCRR